MTEICEGIRALGRKLNHLGLKSAPAKRTAYDGLHNRDSRFFEDLYFTLVKRYVTKTGFVMVIAPLHKICRCKMTVIP